MPKYTGPLNSLKLVSLLQAVVVPYINDTVTVSVPPMSVRLLVNRTDVSVISTADTVLIVGGSQGARAINKALSGAVEAIANRGIQVLWQTGDREYEKWSSYDSRSEGRIRTCKYIDNMAQAYAASDLVVARAGAMSISEITVCGLPAVFIPLAAAAGNHQEYNARMIVDAGAASVIFERELTSSLLEREIIRIVTSDERLAALSKASLKLGKKNAAGVIAGIIIDRYGVN